MISELEELKLENERLKKELSNETLPKKEKRNIKLSKKNRIILIISLLFIIFLSVAIIFFIKTTSISFLTNKTWMGTVDTFYLINSDGKEVQLGGYLEFIEFYDDKSFIKYSLVSDQEENIYINSMSFGTYKRRGNKIYLNMEKYTTNGEDYFELSYETPLIYNSKKNTFYEVQTTNKYMKSIDYDGNETVYKNSDEKVEYKVNYEEFLDYYFVDYNN